MMHGFHTQPFEPFDRADDIEHRVYGSDFVEMHLLGHDAMDAALRLPHLVSAQV